MTFTAGYGWSARSLREQGWLTVTLGLAISVGALTLIMLAEGLVGIPFTLAGVALPYFALMLPGWWQIIKGGSETRPYIRLPGTWTERFVLLILVLLAGAILFNGAYWPFSRADALGIYQPAAQAMVMTGALVPLTGADSLYHTYPILVPLTYTYAYLAAGWQNEYLAKAGATLLSLACLPAAYVLGRMLRDRRAGWLATLILALTPFFGGWASSGYVDLPMAFFYTLAAIFALRFWQSQTTRDAVIAGALVGLAAWTKNAALIGVPLLAIWLIWGVVQRRATVARAGRQPRGVCRRRGRVVYPESGGRGLPDPGDGVDGSGTADARQRARLPQPSGKLQPLRLADRGRILTGIVAAWRGSIGARLILLWTLPFFAAWWLFVSYDPRFLLLFLPPLCALSGDLLARAWDWIGAAWQPRLRVVLILLLLILTAQALFHAVEFKYDLLRDPLMSDAAKHALVRDD